MKHRVLRTPIDTLNIFGAGGIKQGTITEIYGVEKSGKSTFAYQTGGMFLKDNPEGVVHIIDVENSVDYLRLQKTFGYDMSRVKVHNCRTLESAFAVLLTIPKQMENQSIGKIKLGKKEIKLLSKDKLLELDDKLFFSYCDDFEIKENNREKAMTELLFMGAYRGSKEDGYMTPVVAIWDTIAVSKPEVEYETAMKGENAANSGGMGLRARVVEQYSCMMLSSMGGRPCTVLVLNQIRLTGFGSWLGPTESSSGGNALKHNCHYRLKFTQKTTKDVRDANYDEEMGGKTGTVTVVSLEKAKFCPITHDVQIYINDQLGGVIVPSEELAQVAVKIGVIEKVRGPAFVFKDDPDQLKYTWDEDNKTEEDRFIANNPKIRKKLIPEVTKHYRISYSSIDSLYEDVGLGELGKPTEEERKGSERTQKDRLLLHEIDTDNPFEL